jgi:hypothetical protein
MRQFAFLTIVLALAATAVGQDWEGDVLPVEGDLHGTLGVTYDSQYVWRGFDVFANKSAVHVLGDLNLFDTGFGISAVGHRANSSGFEATERWDYTLYYQNGLFQGDPGATNFRLGWVYYDYPHRNSGESIDLQEGHAILSWPSLLPIKGLCPSYVLVKMWPAEGGSTLPDSASGFIHIFMLDYGFTIPGVLPDVPQQLVKLHGEVVFNDGVTLDTLGRFPNPDSDFSHAVFGVSTDLNLGSSVTVTPGVYYQTRMNDTINDTPDDMWFSIGMRYSF